MMSHLNFKIFGLILALAITGCTIKDATPPPNRGPTDLVVAPPDIPTPVVVAEELNQKSIFDVDLEKVSQDYSKKPAPALVLSKTIEPLATILLSKSVYNSYQVQDMTFFHELEELNRAIMYVNDNAPDLLVKSQILKRYKKAALYDCDRDLRGSCNNLTVYSRDPARFIVILDLIAAQETNVVEYYRILRVAKERGTTYADPNLDYLYLRRATELAHHYILVAGTPDEKTKLNARELDELRVHARLTQNALLALDPNTISQDKLDELMKNFNPWDMSRKTSDVLSFGMDRLLAIAARGYLYDRNKDGDVTGLNADFTSKLSTIMNGHDPLYGLGLQFIYDEIKKHESAKILENLGLTEPGDKIQPNEYLYLVDRLYYSHFELKDAEAFWQFTTKDKPELFKAMNKFIRLQIAYLIVWTNEQMRAFFENGATEKFDNIFTLLSGAVANSLRLHAQWDREIGHIKDVVGFANDEFHIEAGDTDLLPPDDPFGQLTRSMVGLQKNIKMLSVYPNMMMLAYVMAKKNFTGKIDTFFGTYSVTPDKVIRSFFLEVIDPWFSFATDGEALKQVELLYALHFTLETETFSAFEKNPILPITAADFFREITNRLTNDYVNKFSDDAAAIKNHMSLNSATITDALQSCNLERVLQIKEAKLDTLLPRTARRTIPYAQMSSVLANGFGDGTSGTVAWALSAPYSSQMPTQYMNDDLTLLRTDVEAQLLTLNSMKGILVSYLNQTGGDVRGVTQAYEDELAKLVNARNSYLLELHKMVNQFSDCDLVIYKHEMDVRTQLYKDEEAYLGKVWDNIQELNSKEGTEQANLLVQINQAKIDVFVGDNKLDPDPQNRLPEVYANGGGYDAYLQSPDHGYYYEYYQFDAKMRARHSLMIHSNGATSVTMGLLDQTAISEYQDKPSDSINPWTVGSREAFIDEGMKRFAKYLGVEANITPNFLINKMNILAHLYRLGPVDKRTGELGCVKAPVQSGIENCYEVSANQLIDLALRTVQISDMSDYDAKVAAWFGYSYKYPQTYWQSITIDDKRRALGPLDMVLQRVASDGKITDVEMSSYFLQSTKNYYDAETSVGGFFFQPRPDVTALIRTNYQDRVNSYQERVETFLAAYKQIQKFDKYQISRVRRTLSEYTDVDSEALDGKKVPTYLSLTYKRRYKSLVDTFNSTTGHEFEK